MTVQCSDCGLELHPESAFCRGCGQRLETAHDQDQMNERQLIARSSNFIQDPEAALNACFEYLEQFPVGSAADHMKFTASLIGTIVTFYLVSQGQFPSLRGQQDYESTALAANMVAEGIPDVLANKVITVGRITDDNKRELARRFVLSTQDLGAQLLLPLFEEALEETESMLVDRNTRAVLERKTMEDIYDDAEIYYQTYEEGDFEGALRGFSYLKELNPMDAYFRNTIGVILSAQGKPREAVREFLYGIHLDPGEPKLTANLMRELATLAIHPSVMEVWNHYQTCRQGQLNQEADKIVELFGNLGSTLTVALACARVGVTPDDISSGTSDFREELPHQERPWLTGPRAQNPEHELTLDGKRVFISYRRADSKDIAKGLMRKMKIDYPSMSVFLDELSMTGGREFTRQIRDQISQADIFLVFIGPYWHSADGRDRLHQTGDVLRREIAWAIRKEISIIPILTEKTQMPQPQSLPEEIRSIVGLHAESLRTDHFESDWGKIQKTMIRVVTARLLSMRDEEQEQKEISRLLNDDPNAWEHEIEEILETVRHQMPKYVPGKSRSGEGIPMHRIDLFGVWESMKIESNERLLFQLVIEDRRDNMFKGELKVQTPSGRVKHTHQLSGEWARVLDVDTDLLLGLYLRYLRDGETREECIIPFHEMIGDTIVGKDAQGIQYNSRNIEPRVDGF